ncbi:hypothetical protein [Bradyrhizobium arachidis]|uniref:Uncharacterized protein n=1 Tax=Bradyrhizobium arachidis TaxID=858423 RepID=A0AAE7NHS0_9BRAD|nr:hypothetical protein [Bradyrhizobium arachidis]QOZ65297.1 hypothetical protein WN72_01655 [Bradyrhizobium arachidis]SFU28015.1 hypothetical protein SAMN05192541_1013 [Bradyrhizobium arachidis]
MALIRRLPVIVLAFLAACLIAEAFYVIVVVEYEALLAFGRLAHLHFLIGVTVLFGLGFKVLCCATVLPASVAIAITELTDRRALWVYLVAGAATALVCYLVVAPFEETLIPAGHNTPRLVRPYPISIVAAGIVAGAAYWLIAGRTAGVWRKMRPAELAS